MVEEWKPLLGDESLGFVSNLGRIKSVKGNILASTTSKNGYHYIVMEQRTRGIKMTIRIHRAVAFAFCEGYQEGFTVNHIDGNKDNNAASNLEWLSHKNNIRHAYRLGLRKNNHRKPKIPHEDREKLQKMAAEGVRIKDLSAMYNVNHSSMIAFLRGRQKKTVIYDFAE